MMIHFAESSSSSEDEAPEGRTAPSSSKDDSTIEMIRRYMADKLGFLDSDEKPHEKVCFTFFSERTSIFPEK